MPSPFPGMDPYLEAPEIWPGVHAHLIHLFSEQLAPQLAPRFFVDIERRVYILEPEDPAQKFFIPDVAVFRSAAQVTPPPAGSRLRRAPTPVLTVFEPVEVRESRLVIKSLGKDRQVVTAIELLSPSNKTQSSHGREEYLAKRREVLRSRVNLVEVDLLRHGDRVPMEPPAGGDYVVHVSRTATRPRGEAFAWSVREELPEVPVPLGRDDPDAVLDLAQAVRATYERARYDLVIDYGRPADPPLASADADWARSLLERRGGAGTAQ